MRGMALALTILTVTTAAEGANVQGVNAAEFHEMCKFISILGSKPEQPTIKLGDVTSSPITKARNDVQQIEFCYASTLDREAFSKLESGEPFEQAQKVSSVNELGAETWTKLQSAWNSSARRVGESRKPAPLSLDEGVRARVHQRLAVLYKKAIALENSIGELDAEMRKNVLDARKNMLAAIFGQGTVDAAIKDKTGAEFETALETMQGASTSFGVGATSYATACGGDGSSEATVAASILSDTACLCALKSVSTEPLCGAGVNTLNSNSPDWTTSKNGKLAINIKSACAAATKAEGVPQDITGELLYEIVARHRAMLGRNKYSVSSDPNELVQVKGNQFILGVYAEGRTGAPKCTGTLNTHTLDAQNGVCVSYHHHLGAGKEIPWIAKIREAAAKLSDNKGKLSLQFSYLARLQSLTTSAESYCEGLWTRQATLEPSVSSTKPNNGSEMGGTPVVKSEKEGSVSSTTRIFADYFVTSVVYLVFT